MSKHKHDVHDTSNEAQARVIEAVARELSSSPPTIGLIGVSGVGKSSTINAMFGTSLPISHVAACTKEFKATDLQVQVRSGHAVGREASLRVVDAPGLGEDIELDPKYLNMYREQLTRCDVILWVLAARNRAIALEQQYLRELRSFLPKIVFGVNQVDLVDPMDWDAKINLPSTTQEDNTALILADRKAKLESVARKPVTVVAYSARFGWNLQELFTVLVESCPKERAWIFGAIKAFKPEDFLPADVRETLWAKTHGGSDHQKGT